MSAGPRPWCNRGVVRTTGTLDDDIARAVEELRRERGWGLSAALNEVARRGLATGAPTPARFVQRASALGSARLPLDDVGAALEAAEGPDHRG